jgi:hypothetical protein
MLALVFPLCPGCFLSSNPLDRIRVMDYRTTPVKNMGGLLVFSQQTGSSQAYLPHRKQRQVVTEGSS